MIRNPLKMQVFNDGIVKIYSVSDDSESGNTPKEALTYKHTLRYKEKTVGIARQQAAMQEMAEVAYVLRCPRLRDVSTQDVAIPNNGLQYSIRRVQYPEDVSPPVMDLELVRVGVDYAHN